MLESLKKDVCEIAKRAQKDGLCKHKSGNFSAKKMFVKSPKEHKKTDCVSINQEIFRQEIKKQDMS